MKIINGRIAPALMAIALSTAPLQALRAEPRSTLHLPYAQAGLSQQQAAAILLDRFTFGARPGDAEQVVAIGLERWFEQQLTADAAESKLDAALIRYPATGMTHQELFARFPSGGQISAHARRFYDLIPPADTPVDSDWTSRKLVQFRKEQGYQDQELDLYQQLTGQKIAHAVLAQNQLREVLTDFWQNHFFVSTGNFRARPWVLAYEREAIRPNALGHFGELLMAASKHPAMVQTYLGDAQKQTVTEADTTMGRALAGVLKNDTQRVAAIKEELDTVATEEDLILQKRFWPESGVNPEYARVVLRVQTLGDEAAYTQRDLNETARVFTGWTTVPQGASAEWFKRGFKQSAAAGFVQQDSFLFRADRHDATQKQVLGRTFAAGGGVDEGERLLKLLAAHPATAKYIARKLAVRFVGEEPSKSLQQSLAASFRSSDGDIRAVLRTLVESREFWKQAATRSKVKTPFEYVASALRASQAEVTDAQALTKWIADIGQPLYSYLDYGGYPDSNGKWINSATLLTRMNFALSLGSGRIKGVSVKAEGADQLAMTIASPQFQLH